VDNWDKLRNPRWRGRTIGCSYRRQNTSKFNPRWTSCVASREGYYFCRCIWWLTSG